MKKKLVLLMSVALIASLTGCTTENSNTDNDSIETVDDSDEKTSGSKEFSYENSDGSAVFQISVKEKIDIDSWLGICDEGEYLYETDADNYDLTYAYPEDYYDEDGNINSSPYTYNLEYSHIDDGSYTLVLTDTDCDGYVIFYAPCTIKKGKLKVKTDELKHNQRPDDIAPVTSFTDDYTYPDGYDDLEYPPVDYTITDDIYTLPDDNDGGSTYTEYERDPMEFAELNDSKLSVDEVIGTSIPNDTLVLKYKGSVNVCGESSLYYVLHGFDDNGEVDWISATSRLWYFFDDETTYYMAFEAAKANDDLIIKDYNPVSHYFSVITFFRNSWDTYDEIIRDVNNGILPDTMPPTPEYIVVE